MNNNINSTIKESKEILDEINYLIIEMEEILEKLDQVDLKTREKMIKATIDFFDKI